MYHYYPTFKFKYSSHGKHEIVSQKTKKGTEDLYFNKKKVEPKMIYNFHIK